MKLLKLLWEAFLEIFSKKIIDEPMPELDTPEPVHVPPETPKVHSKAWRGGTMAERKAMYQLAMKVCAEEGLDKLQSKLLPGYTLRADMIVTIEGESGFNQWCENLHTFDYGLCQFSKRYYLVEYGMTPQDAINQPEKCLRIMAKNFKSLRRRNWVAFQVLEKMPKAKLKIHMDMILNAYK